MENLYFELGYLHLIDFMFIFNLQESKVADLENQIDVCKKENQSLKSQITELYE